MNVIRGLRIPPHWGIVLVVCAAALYLAAAVSLTIEAADHDTIDGDMAVATLVQNASAPGLNDVVHSLNWFGKPIPLAVLAGAISLGLLFMRRPWEAFLLLPTTFSHAINWFLKAVAESPRPTAEQVRITDPSSGFGFPSSHTMAVVVFCGIVVYLAWRVIDHRQLRYGIQALALAVVLGICFSRIYSGAHWPSDVLGGVMWGTFYTTIMVVIFHRVRPMPRLRPASQADLARAAA